MKQILLAILLMITSPEISNADILKHDGKSSLEPEMLEEIIHDVVNELPGISGSKKQYYKDLLLETAAVETRLGNYDIKGRQKSSLGIMQIQLATANDMANWLYKKHKERFETLMQYADEDMSMRQNLEQNVHFSVAMAAYYYARMAPFARMENRNQRAALWKKIYNTPLGKGTEKIYLQRCKECLNVD